MILKELSSLNVYQFPLKYWVWSLDTWYVLNILSPYNPSAFNILRSQVIYFSYFPQKTSLGVSFQVIAKGTQKKKTQ